MNATRKSLIAAAALAIIGTSASAFEAYGEQVPQSTLTRAEVTAELVSAHQAGNIIQTAEAYGQTDAALLHSRSSMISRSQVRSELAQARSDQRYDAANEAYGTVIVGTTATVNRGAAE